MLPPWAPVRSASARSVCANANPAAVSRSGATQRLFTTSSGSVRCVRAGARRSDRQARRAVQRGQHGARGRVADGGAHRAVRSAPRAPPARARRPRRPSTCASPCRCSARCSTTRARSPTRSCPSPARTPLPRKHEPRRNARIPQPIAGPGAEFATYCGVRVARAASVRGAGAARRPVRRSRAPRTTKPHAAHTCGDLHNRGCLAAASPQVCRSPRLRKAPGARPRRADYFFLSDFSDTGASPDAASVA